MFKRIEAFPPLRLPWRLTIGLTLSARDGARRQEQPPAVLLRGVELTLLVDPAFRSEVAGVEWLELERIRVERERIILRDLLADEERVLEVYGVRGHFARGFFGHDWKEGGSGGEMEGETEGFYSIRWFRADVQSFGGEVCAMNWWG